MKRPSFFFILSLLGLVLLWKGDFFVNKPVSNGFLENQRSVPIDIRGYLKASNEPSFKEASISKNAVPAHVAPSEKDLKENLSRINGAVSSNEELEQNVNEALEKSEVEVLEAAPADNALLFSIDEADNWSAPDLEYAHSALFSNNEKLADYALESTSCKSKFCKVSVYVENQVQALSLVGDLSSALLMNYGEIDLQMKDYEGNGVAEFYIKVPIKKN